MQRTCSGVENFERLRGGAAGVLIGRQFDRSADPQFALQLFDRLSWRIGSNSGNVATDSESHRLRLGVRGIGAKNFEEETARLDFFERAVDAILIHVAFNIDEKDVFP